MARLDVSVNSCVNTVQVCAATLRRGDLEESSLGVCVGELRMYACIYVCLHAPCVNVWMYMCVCVYTCACVTCAVTLRRRDLDENNNYYYIYIYIYTHTDTYTERETQRHRDTHKHTNALRAMRK